MKSALPIWLATSLLGCACAASRADQWTDPAVYRLRLQVAPDSSSSAEAELAGRLREAFVQSLRARGFEPPRAGLSADGVLRLPLRCGEDGTCEAAIDFQLASGEVIDDVKLRRQRSQLANEPGLQELAQALVMAFEHNSRVQTLARTGALAPPP